MSCTRKTLIAEVKATPVSVPTKRACAWSQGNSRGCTRTIIEITTRDGLTGLGEAPGSAAADLINHRLAGLIQGQDFIARENIRAACVGDHKDFGTIGNPTAAIAFAGVEIALWDLLGQHLQRPLFDVLGGAVRDQAPFVSYAFSVDLADGYSENEVPELMAGIATDSIAASGASMFEFKVGRHSIDTDIETVLAVRAALHADTAIAVDPNMAFDIDTARRFLAATAAANLANIEEPVSTLSGLEQLRNDFGVPVSSHCTDMEIMRHYPLIDSVVADFYGNGGISGNIRNAAMASAHGKRYWLRACNELGVTWAAFCHLGMSLRELERPAQHLMNWLEDDLIVGDEWQVRSGGVRPPDRPGLGVELDRDAMAHYAERFRREGEYTHYEST